MAESLPFPGIRPFERPSYHALRPCASYGQTFCNLRCSRDGVERRELNGTQERSREQKLELTHDVAVRHAGKEGPTDEMSHAVLLDEAADLRHALLGAADDEAILHELVEIRRDRRVDERMAPAARVLFAVGDHDVLLGQ